MVINVHNITHDLFLFASSIQQFLCSPTFWTKHIRIYTLIRLGEIVTSVKEGVVKSLKRPQDVLQWRTLFSFDPKLKLLVGQAPKNKFQGQQQHMSYDGTEIDCGIRFLSDTLAHFERMCKVGLKITNLHKFIFFKLQDVCRNLITCVLFYRHKQVYQTELK